MYIILPELVCHEFTLLKSDTSTHEEVWISITFNPESTPYDGIAVWGIVIILFMRIADEAIMKQS